MILWAHHSEGVFYAALQDFIAVRVFGETKDMGKGTILAVQRSGKIIGAVLFHNYQKAFGTVEISGAGHDGWMTRGVLREMADYAFRQLKCQTIAMRCDPDDARMTRMARVAGFKRTDIPNMRGPGRPEAFYTLNVADWKFTEKDHG